METGSNVERENRLEQENRELRLRISQLQNELAERESELARMKSQRPCLEAKFDRSEIERYRGAQLQAERLLEAREQSHRQQIHRLEQQVRNLNRFFDSFLNFVFQFLGTDVTGTIKSRNKTSSTICIKKLACWT